MRVRPWLLAIHAGCYFACSGNVPDQIVSAPPAPTTTASSGTEAESEEDSAVVSPQEPMSPPPEPPAPMPEPKPSFRCDRTLTSLRLTESLLGLSGGKKVWLLRGQDGDAVVSITIREGNVNAGDKGTFGAEQMQPASAAVRLQIQTQCEAHGDHFHCGPNYVAESGEWSVDELGQRVGDSFALTLAANAKEARVRGSSVTMLPNGKSICIAETKLSGALSAP
jgi:hypothetical protein